MIFRNRQKNPQTMIFVGMLFMVLFNAWPRLLHLTFNLGPDWIDAIRGYLFGVSASLLLWAVRLKCCQRRHGDQ
jgi:hypothetical protein